MVVLSLGSNLGSRVENLNRASKLLSIDNIRFSHVYESNALLPNNAPQHWNIPFLNMVVIGYTSLSPTELLNHVKHIERSLGRHSKEFWEPRTLDIDILLYGESSIDTENLTIPHKEMHNRDFVLVPACDICPRLLHSRLHLTLESLLLNLKTTTVVKKCKFQGCP